MEWAKGDAVAMEDKLLEALKWACHIANIQKICENCSNEEFEACQAQCSAENKMSPFRAYNRKKVECRLRLALAHVGLDVRDLYK